MFAGSIVSLFTSLPAAFIAVLAGLALLNAISGNLLAALEDSRDREALLITFFITASGLSLYGLSSALWGVVIGYAVHLVLVGRPASFRKYQKSTLGVIIKLGEERKN